MLPWLAAPPADPAWQDRSGGSASRLSVALAPAISVPASSAVAAVTLAALTWSFAIDVAWLARQHRAS